MAEKKPKKPDPREGGKEIGDASATAAGLFDSRSGQLSGATGATMAAYLDALKTGRAGELSTNKAWLTKNAKVLKKAANTVTKAAQRYTQPTALSGALRGSAASALADPSSPLLDTLTSQAQADLADDGQLSPEEEMNATQGSRAAWAARGFGTSAPAALSEVLGRTGYVQQRQDRARAFAGGVEGLGQAATNSARNFGTTVNAQDIAKQGQDFGIKSTAAQFRLGTNPALMAYNTPSMAPTALSAAGQTTAQADVFPQVLGYEGQVNDFNGNAEWSDYMGKLNRYYASKYGGMGATAGAAGGGFNTGGALTGALSGAAAGAVAGSVVPGVGTVVGGLAGGLLGGLGGGLS